MASEQTKSIVANALGKDMKFYSHRSSLDLSKYNLVMSELFEKLKAASCITRYNSRNLTGVLSACASIINQYTAPPYPDPDVIAHKDDLALVMKRFYIECLDCLYDWCWYEPSSEVKLVNFQSIFLLYMAFASKYIDYVAWVFDKCGEHPEFGWTYDFPIPTDINETILRMQNMESMISLGLGTLAATK
jgi:hypothetical protein